MFLLSPVSSRLLVLMAGMVVFASCSKQSAAPPPPAVASESAPAKAELPGAKIFAVKGVVEELLPGGKVVRIRHEAIPDYMEAMSMPFDVKDPQELKGLKAGDEVSFRMLVTEDDGWIDQVKVTKVATTEALPPAVPSVRRVRNVEPLNLGDALPSYPFTNQLGQAFNTADFKGQALAITFIFTRCPFPDFCPRMTKGFGDAYQLLSSDPDAPKNWHLISLSFDPEYDTPETLARYSKNYVTNHSPQWSFATGAIIEIDDLTERFGLSFSRQVGGPIFDHNLRTVVVDARGRVFHVFIGNQWTGVELAEKIIEAARVPVEDAAPKP